MRLQDFKVIFYLFQLFVRVLRASLKEMSNLSDHTFTLNR